MTGEDNRKYKGVVATVEPNGNHTKDGSHRNLSPLAAAAPFLYSIYRSRFIPSTTTTPLPGLDWINKIDLIDTFAEKIAEAKKKKKKNKKKNKKKKDEKKKEEKIGDVSIFPTRNDGFNQGTKKTTTSPPRTTTKKQRKPFG